MGSVEIAALSFLAVALGVAAVGRILAGRPSREERRVTHRLRELGGVAPEAEADDRGSRFGGLGERAKAWLLPRNGDRVGDLRSRLSLAGYRSPSAVLNFTATQLALVVILAVAFGSGAALWGCSWKKVLLWAAAGGGAGLIAPTYVLSSLIQSRQRTLRNALPDAMDIMVLSVEGGSSVNAALAWAADELRSVHPILGEELVTVQREVQLGLSPGEAFRAFAERSGLAEVRDLAATLLQAEKYGASVGKALRVDADNARQERQLWAEEVAQKAAVKIIFPMLLCIFPAIFVVLLGPAAMQMSKLMAR